MKQENSNGKNPFVLKREGNFRDALLAYAHQYAEAMQEGNEYIEQTCLDQMIDIRLLEFLREGRKFHNLKELKGSIQTDISEVLSEFSIDEPQRGQFERSWEEFGRQKEGYPLFSIRKEQLIPSRNELEQDHFWRELH